MCPISHVVVAVAVVVVIVVVFAVVVVVVVFVVVAAAVVFVVVVAATGGGSGYGWRASGLGGAGARIIPVPKRFGNSSPDSAETVPRSAGRRRGTARSNQDYVNIQKQTPSNLYSGKTSISH